MFAKKYTVCGNYFILRRTVCGNCFILRRTVSENYFIFLHTACGNSDVWRLIVTPQFFTPFALNIYDVNIVISHGVELKEKYPPLIYHFMFR